MTNEELIRKAVVTTADMATAGKLSPEQADKFLDYVIEELALSKEVRIARPKAETWELHKLGLARRVAMPATEATATAVRRGVSFTKISLTPHEVIVPFAVGDTVKEINLEGDDFVDHVIRMMATACANNLEELYLLGDSLGPAIVESEYLEGGSTTDYVKDEYLGLDDGWMRLADGGHVYDAANASIGPTVWSEAIKAMPTKYRKQRSMLRFFCSPDLEQTWREKVAQRLSLGGDEQLGAAQSVSPFGIPLVPVPLLPWEPPVVEHVVLPGTTAVDLRYAPMSDEVVLPSTLGSTPVTPYVEGTDYDMNYTNGTIARNAGGTIGDGATVKVTYEAQPQALLTHMQNMILAIGRDIRIERDRDIFARTDLFAITVRVDMQVENLDALVKVINIKTS